MAKPKLPLSSLSVRPVGRGDWTDIERLFGENGACGGCWCMWWHFPHGGKLWENAKGRKNRESLKDLVKDGKIHAVMAYSGEEPVGWCCFGPAAGFPRLESIRALKRERPEGTWSVVCFYIPARWRGSGVATALLKEATEIAFARGARRIEGYPVVPKTSSEPVPAVFAWTGVPAIFEAAGYREMEQPGATRPTFFRVLP